MQSKTIIDLLSNETVTKFIGQHLNDDVKKLALSAKKYANIDIKAISTLISLYQKAKLKLPEHYKMMAAFNAKSYEQSTSEAVANYKAGIMDIENKKIVNLTGGIGIDDWAMARLASQIDSCDIDEEIHSMANYNIGLFKNLNIKRHLQDGLAFIKIHPKTDIIYIDPDRRPNSGRVFRLEDSEPDILSNMELLLEKANHVWIKISPMADITYLEKAIPSIQQLYVIAWLGEVKEILALCSKTGAAEKKISAVNIGSDKKEIFEKGQNRVQSVCNNIGNYLYEPNRAIIKAGLSSAYAFNLNLHMLSPNSHFFISDELKDNFYGRTFKIIERVEYKPKLLKSYFEEHKIKQANVTTRNFRETPEELKKRYKIKDGGDNYLCFTTDQAGISWLFHCMQILKKQSL